MFVAPLLLKFSNFLCEVAEELRLDPVEVPLIIVLWCVVKLPYRPYRNGWCDGRSSGILTSFLGLLEIGWFPKSLYILWIFMNHNFIHIYHQIIEPWKLLTIISDACESSQVTRMKFREQTFALTFTEVQHLTEGINKLKLGVTTELRDCEKEVSRGARGVGEIHSS